jgi:hypothetical protein
VKDHTINIISLAKNGLKIIIYDKDDIIYVFMANRRQAKTQITKSAKTTNYPLSATHEHDHFV